MIRYRFGFAALVVVSVLLAQAGCSSNTRLTGKVTFNGQNVDDGTITLKSGQGRQVSGKIKDGQYSVDSEGGLAAGSYKVAIFWRQKGKEIPSNDPPNK